MSGAQSNLMIHDPKGVINFNHKNSIIFTTQCGYLGIKRKLRKNHDNKFHDETIKVAKFCYISCHTTNKLESLEDFRYHAQSLPTPL